MCQSRNNITSRRPTLPRPRYHALATVAGVWILSSKRPSRRTMLSAIACGLLIDLDHLVDWAWNKRQPESLHSVIPLHGWEWAPLLYLLGPKPAFYAFLGHLAIDQLSNNVRNWATYFLTYRTFRRFDAKYFSREGGRAKWLDEPWHNWW